MKIQFDYVNLWKKSEVLIGFPGILIKDTHSLTNKMYAIVILVFIIAKFDTCHFYSMFNCFNVYVNLFFIDKFTIKKYPFSDWLINWFIESSYSLSLQLIVHKRTVYAALVMIWPLAQYSMELARHISCFTICVIVGRVHW